LEFDGLRVIDTPGIRSFGLWKLTLDDLPWYFPEFASADPCKFTDCTHTHEPSCGVKLALQTGAIARERYETYVRIRSGL
jgi:ribosome biogenesis GTPase